MRTPLTGLDMDDPKVIAGMKRFGADVQLVRDATLCSGSPFFRRAARRLLGRPEFGPDERDIAAVRHSALWVRAVFWSRSPLNPEEQELQAAANRLHEACMWAARYCHAHRTS